MANPINMSTDDVSKPTTAAAFLSRVGSPDQDVFTGRSSPISYVISYMRWYLARVDNATLCSCYGEPGCSSTPSGNSCPGYNPKCYSILPVLYLSSGEYELFKSVYVCMGDKRLWVRDGSQCGDGTGCAGQRNTYRYEPWEDGVYSDDPRFPRRHGGVGGYAQRTVEDRPIVVDRPEF